MCREFSHCYDDNICLWTDGSEASQSAAKMDCEQRHNSFLPRITDSNIQSKLAEFRDESGDLLIGRGFWIDVKAVGVTNFHWIDGSPLAGWFVCVCVRQCSVARLRKLMLAVWVTQTFNDVLCKSCHISFFTLVYWVTMIFSSNQNQRSSGIRHH